MQIIKYHNESQIYQAALALKNNKIVVLPTDTVYGLCGNGLKKEVHKKIYQIKKRTPNKVFPLFVKDLAMAEEIVFLNNCQKKFLRQIWAGKVSVVLKIKNKRILKIYHQDTIALRIPNHYIISKIFEFINFPLIGTSANISGMPEALSAREIVNQFKNEKIKPDYLLDFGMLPKSQTSTIIDICDEDAKIIREGAYLSSELITIWLSCNEK